MDSMDTNVIVKFQRMCDCWLCPGCGCENMVTDAVCAVCGTGRTKESVLLRAGEEEVVPNDGFIHLHDGPARGTHSGAEGSRGVVGGGTGVPGGGIRSPGGSPVGTGGFSTTGGGYIAPEPEGSNIGLIVAIIFIVIAVIAVSVGILLYQ